jgi:alkylated DNA repair dioxygenase AlkB
MEAHLFPGLFAGWDASVADSVVAYDHTRDRQVWHFDSLPPFIESMKSRFMEVVGWTPSACMMNRYHAGASVPWHLDSEVESLAIVSLGGEAEFGYADSGDASHGEVECDWWEPTRIMLVTLQHGDLLVFPDAACAAHTVHNIDPRCSLVFRLYEIDSYKARGRSFIW